MPTQLVPSSSGNQLLNLLPGEGPNVGGELEMAGLAFGELVERTGQAIAETQNRLNLTGANTASALANTLVDVVAVKETIYDDNGNITDSNSHTRKLPLINFIDPVFYEWPTVRLQGQFYASEIADAKHAYDRAYTSKWSSQQHGLLVLLGGGRTAHSYQVTETERNELTTSDVSVGRVRMNAMLKPRTDVTIPKPTQVLRGPSLSILEGAITDIHEGGNASAPVIERTMSVIVQFNKRTGEAIPGKDLSIETDGLAWEYVGDSATNASGQVTIMLHRYFQEDEDTAPTNFVLTARKGMVQNSATLYL